MDLSILNLNNLSTKEIAEQNSVRSYIAMRRIKNIPQGKLAEALEVDQRVVSAYEREYSKIDYDFNQKYRDAVDALLQEATNDDE